MKKETIHYISDIKYFSTIKSSKYSSKKEMLKAHINYIKKKSVETVGDEKIILKTAELLDKKENSRVALSFHVAIPNDVIKENYKDFMNEVIEFFSEKFDIDKQNFFAVLHETHELSNQFGTENKHIHIVANTRTRKDKQIRLQPKDLRELHRDWNKFLENKGYSIKKEKEKLNFGIEIRKDKELQELYKMYLQTKRELKDLEHTIKNQKPAPEQPRPPEQPQPRPPEPKPSEPKPSSSPTYSHSYPKQQKQQQDEEIDMKISVSKATDKKPYPTDFEVVNIKTLRELKEIIKTRFYSNIVWQNGYRSSKNAVSVSNFLVYDIDGTDRIERVEKILREKNIKALITTTKSHTENSHHFRVLIKTDRELQENELQYYKHFMKVIADDLNINCDKATFDLARMYAPNPNASFIFINGKELEIDRYLEKAKQITLKEIAEKEYKLYKLSQPTQNHWISVDVNRLLSLDIEELINHFEGISKKWQEGSQVYVRTNKNEKYGINKKYNVAYNFSEMEGYGVISYLQEQLNTTHLLNIAKYLQDNNISDNLIFINDEVFTQKLNRCLNNSYDFDGFIENVRDEFNVKSVFVDFNSGTIKIGQFKVKLDDNELDEIYNLYNPSPRGPKGPGL